MSGVTTVETVPSMALSGPLPELPELASTTSATSPLRRAVSDWSASWDDPDGEATRVGARAIVAEHLAKGLDARSIEEALRPLVWMESEVGDVTAFPAVLAGPLQEAQALTRASGEARRRGDLRQALEQGLAAADLYRSVTPEAVARRMVTRAEDRVEEVSAVGQDHESAAGARVTTPTAGIVLPGDGGAAMPTAPAPDEAALDRAVHLVNGARRALGEGEHALAIQRAFYAIQVLDGRMHDPDR